jgi:hypothetical protein
VEGLFSRIFSAARFGLVWQEHSARPVLPGPEAASPLLLAETIAVPLTNFAAFRIKIPLYSSKIAVNTAIWQYWKCANKNMPYNPD